MTRIWLCPLHGAPGHLGPTVVQSNYGLSGHIEAGIVAIGDFCGHCQTIAGETKIRSRDQGHHRFWRRGVGRTGEVPRRRRNDGYD